MSVGPMPLKYSLVHSWFICMLGLVKLFEMDGLTELQIKEQYSFSCPMGYTFHMLWILEKAQYINWTCYFLFLNCELQKCYVSGIAITSSTASSIFHLHDYVPVVYFEREMERSAQEIIAIIKLSKSKDCYL